MKTIYLRKEIEHNTQRRLATIDRIPPKSTYTDRNRSDIVVSETFQPPSDDVSEKLYASARKFFEETKMRKEKKK